MNDYAPVVTLLSGITACVPQFHILHAIFRSLVHIFNLSVARRTYEVLRMLSLQHSNGTTEASPSGPLHPFIPSCEGRIQLLLWLSIGNTRRPLRARNLLQAWAGK